MLPESGSLWIRVRDGKTQEKETEERKEEREWGD
jgi:hypothetical protein